MASDLSVPRVGAAAAAAETGRVRSSGQGPRGMAATPDGAAEMAVDGGKPMPNPTLRLEPGLALVVIEFRDGAGKVRDTIPTQAQLDAYRSSQRASNAPVPLPGQAPQQDAGARGAGDKGGREAPDPVGAAAAEPGGVPVVAQPKGPGDDAVAGMPVKASETGTA